MVFFFISKFKIFHLFQFIIETSFHEKVIQNVFLNILNLSRQSSEINKFLFTHGIFDIIVKEAENVKSIKSKEAIIFFCNLQMDCDENQIIMYKKMNIY